MAQPPDEGVIPRDPTVWNYIEPSAPAPEPEAQPLSPETAQSTPAPYDTINVALDGWEYRIFTEWLGEDEIEQKKNVDIFLDILKKYDSSASATHEKSKKHSGYSWVFRFGLLGDPANVTEAIENTDAQLLSMTSNWKVKNGTAKALVKRMDGTEDVYELPPDLISSDIATTMYRLLDLVQTGGTKPSPETESRTSELRQMTSPDSDEYCTEHNKTGAEHTDEEREQDILGAKGEEGYPEDRVDMKLSYPSRPEPVPEPEEKEPLIDIPSLVEGIQRGEKEDEAGHKCPNCGSYNTTPINEAKTQYRCLDCHEPWECEKCTKDWEKSEDDGIASLESELEGLETAIQSMDFGNKSWTPGYQAVPKALTEGKEPFKHKPIKPRMGDLPGSETTEFDETGRPKQYPYLEQEPMPEPEPQPDWGRWKKDVDTYSTEMSNLIDTVLKIGDDPTGTPEAIEKTGKVAADRMKEIVDWATELLEKVTKQMETSLDAGPDPEYIIDSLQNMIDYGNRFHMLLIQSQEKAKTMSIPQ